jgi:hypothetical protein
MYKKNKDIHKIQNNKYYKIRSQKKRKTILQIIVLIILKN